jgi:uncharacterized protein (TIGR00661 family)
VFGHWIGFRIRAKLALPASLAKEKAKKLSLLKLTCLTMKRSPRILVCPLDWGLGHATRCIPLIEEIQRQGGTVLIGASGNPLTLLAEALPNLERIHFPGFQARYPKKNLAMAMILQLPRLFYSIYKEHGLLKKVISEHRIDAVISDNRFGLFTKRIPCIFMTHQLFIKAPKSFHFTEPLLYKINAAFIHQYTACWVPDVASEDNLSGALSHKKKCPERTVFIGPLSRFKKEDKKTENNQQRWDLLVLLSGPEPQRSIFEEKVLEQLQGTQLNILLVRGIPGNPVISFSQKNINIKNHLDTAAMKEALLLADLVLSRPGYSSIMDLAQLQKKAIFVPTPGQTEQEYLANNFSKKGACYFQTQDQLDLKLLMKRSLSSIGLNMPMVPDLLQNAVRDFLLLLH